MHVDQDRIDLAMDLLRSAAATDPAGKTGVATKLGRGCGRSYLSRILSDNDPLTMPMHIAERVIDVYQVIDCCPALNGPQRRAECHRLNAGGAPTHNPSAMRIWKTCQSCAHKPIKE